MAIYFARPAALFKHQRKLPQLPIMLVRKQLVGAQYFNSSANTSNQTGRASTE